MTSAQRVIITAGASGIGLATVERFRAAGALVAICDVDEAKLAAAAIAHPGLVTSKVDVSKSDQVQSFIETVQARLGGVDVLVNNAGIAGEIGPIEDISDDGWTASFNVNIHGAFFMMRAVVPLMKAQRSGAIINISTGSTVTLPLNRSPYIASKWAIEGLTRAAARELGPHNIRVNAIRPGFVDSERMRGILGDIAQKRGVELGEVEAEVLQYISMRSKVQPQEIGDMAVFLASDKALHVTGQLMSVDGNIEWE
ncbi:SDR family oxidoreductase [Govanella unica]|uniref:SDR family oxidoreductase n=1 Tax=Govanella unica TaxID=2975056 RepID=A0A9X3TZ12_9PROT|nr:SDR family oxidoreductase [Govania unica]MDA5194396.1 SDR family oxidoreductase [Govania unica]